MELFDLFFRSRFLRAKRALQFSFQALYEGLFSQRPTAAFVPPQKIRVGNALAEA